MTCCSSARSSNIGDDIRAARGGHAGDDHVDNICGGNRACIFCGRASLAGIDWLRQYRDRVRRPVRKGFGKGERPVCGHCEVARAIILQYQSRSGQSGDIAAHTEVARDSWVVGASDEKRSDQKCAEFFSEVHDQILSYFQLQARAVPHFLERCK